MLFNSQKENILEIRQTFNKANGTSATISQKPAPT
jgi:hypothetical protein